MEESGEELPTVRRRSDRIPTQKDAVPKQSTIMMV